MLAPAERPLQQIVADVMRQGIRPIAYLPIVTDVGLRTERVEYPDMQVARALGVVGFAGRLTRSLSSGERQRVRLASALAEGVQFAALDEPCRHLDPHHVEALSELISKRSRQGTQLAVVDRRGLLADGAFQHERDRANSEPSPPARSPKDHDALRLTIPVPFLLSHRGRPRARTELKVARGALVVLMGPNGGGKTSLLEAMARSASHAKYSIGFSRQEPELQIFASTPSRELDEVARVRQGAPWCRAPHAPSLHSFACRFQLESWLLKSTPHLPLGVLSLLGAVLALWMGHDLVLLDEPTQGLDTKMAQQLATELVRCAQDGARIVVASHDPEVIRVANTVWTLQNGQLDSSQGNR